MTDFAKTEIEKAVTGNQGAMRDLERIWKSTEKMAEFYNKCLVFHPNRAFVEEVKWLLSVRILRD
jgi:hypothetical protein